MSKEKKYNFISGNATHVGQIRKANEDYFGSFETLNGYLFLVCDGMGGHVGGAKASRIAVESIRNFVSEKFYENPLEALLQAIIFANQSIMQYTQTHPELKGMGSTCVALLVRDDTVFYAHVGDSRIYLLSGSGMIQLTRDHSFVQSLVDMGEITEEEAEEHPRKNEINNALGLQSMKPPTLSLHPLYPVKDDIFLLCSDGLTGMVKNEAIQNVLKSDMDIQEMADRLIEMANVAGGLDNITVQLIKFLNVPARKKNNQDEITNLQHKTPKKRVVISAAIILLLVFLGFVFKDKLFRSSDTDGTIVSVSEGSKFPEAHEKIKTINIPWEINKSQHPVDTLNILSFYDFEGLDNLSVIITDHKFMHVLDDEVSLAYDATYVTEGFTDSNNYFILSTHDTVARGLLAVSIHEKPVSKSPSTIEINQKPKTKAGIENKKANSTHDSLEKPNEQKLKNELNTKKETLQGKVKPPGIYLKVEANAPGISIDIIGTVVKDNHLTPEQAKRLSVEMTNVDNPMFKQEGNLLKCTPSTSDYGIVSTTYKLLSDGKNLIFSDSVTLELMPEVKAVDDVGVYDTSGVYTFNVRKNDVIVRANPALVKYKISKAGENVSALMLYDSLIEITLISEKKNLPDKIEIEYLLQYGEMKPRPGKLTVSKRHE